MLYKDMVFHDPVSIYGPIFCCKLFHDMAPDWEPTYGGEREVHRSERREFARSERRLFTRSDRLHVKDFVTLARVHAKT